MIRAPFTTEVRPFRGSDLVVTQRWYRVDKRLPTLPFPTIFGNQAWETTGFNYDDQGEVRVPYRKFDKRKPPVIGVVDHFCGTIEDFQKGEVYNTDLPDTVYAPDGLPVCCRPAPRDAVLLGGKSFTGFGTIYRVQGLGFDTLFYQAGPYSWQNVGEFEAILYANWLGETFDWLFSRERDPADGTYGVWQTFGWDGQGERTFDASLVYDPPVPPTHPPTITITRVA